MLTWTQNQSKFGARHYVFPKRRKNCKTHQWNCNHQHVTVRYKSMHCKPGIRRILKFLMLLNCYIPCPWKLQYQILKQWHVKSIIHVQVWIVIRITTIIHRLCFTCKQQCKPSINQHNLDNILTLFDLRTFIINQHEASIELCNITMINFSSHKHKKHPFALDPKVQNCNNITILSSLRIKWDVSSEVE